MGRRRIIHWERWGRVALTTHSVFLLIEKKRGNSPTGVRTIAGLATDINSSAANAEMVDGAGDSARRRRHLVVVM